MLFFQIDTLFLMNSPLCWGSAMLGYYTAAYIAVGTIGGIAYAKITKAVCKITDDTIALLACLFTLVASLYRASVMNTIMMFVGEYYMVLF